MTQSGGVGQPYPWSNPSHDPHPLDGWKEPAKGQ